MSPERTVRVQLVIDEHGAVRAVKGVGEESGRTEHKLHKLDKEVRGLGKSFGGLKNMIGFGLGSLGAGGLIFGLSSVASKTKEIALETERFHTQTGIGTQSSLYYDKALKARGLTSEAVGKAFGILAKNLKSAELQEHSFAVTQAKSAAKGKISTSVIGRQASAFQELGINLTQFNKLSEQGKLEQVTKHFEALAPGMKKSRLERELFGRGGNELSIVLEKGNLGLTHQIALVKKFFPSVKGGANAMKELVEKENESKLASEGLELALGEKLIPAMTSVMSWFSKVAIEIQKGKGSWGELGKAVGEVVQWFKGLWSAFEGIVGPTNAVKLAVGGLVGVMAVGKIASFIETLGPLWKFFGLAAAILAAAAALKHFFGAQHKQKMLDYFIQHPKSISARGLAELDPKELKELQHIARVDPEKKRYPHVVFDTPARLKAIMRHEEHGGAAGLKKVEEQYGEGKREQLPHDNTREARIHLYLDTQKVAEAVIHNPRARRIIAESTSIFAHGMAARK